MLLNRYPKKDGQWYKKIGMGINKIYTIMKEMKEIAGISTNKRLTPYRYMSTWGGGGVVLFFSYVGLDPVFTPPPQKKNIKHPKMMFEILQPPKNIPNCVHRNDPLN